MNTAYEMVLGLVEAIVITAFILTLLFWSGVATGGV